MSRSLGKKFLPFACFFENGVLEGATLKPRNHQVRLSNRFNTLIQLLGITLNAMLKPRMHGTSQTSQRTSFRFAQSVPTSSKRNLHWSRGVFSLRSFSEAACILWVSRHKGYVLLRQSTRSDCRGPGVKRIQQEQVVLNRHCHRR
jgi:hypothetical protein